MSNDLQKHNTNEKRSLISSSYLWAVFFMLIIGGWMASGYFMRMKSDQSTEQTSQQGLIINTTENNKNIEPEQNKLFQVRVKTYYAKPRYAELTIRGRTEVDARVQVKAQTAGVVEHLPIKKGSEVKKGEILCQIETADRQATLLQAKANIAKAQADFEANAVLAKKGHTAKLRLTSFQAELDAARATLKRAEIDLERTKIMAPFDGIVEEQHAKVGDYLAVGNTCATLVSLNPLIVVGTVSELNIGNLETGMPATVELVTGETAKGKIHFISSSADVNTRTFRIEVIIDNKQAKMRDGITTDIKIPLQSKPAHLLPPSILVLNDKGQIGVRTIKAKTNVNFIPIKILNDTPNGVWVAGLPEEVQIITVGQDYVASGQQVEVIETIANKNLKAPNGS